MLLVLNMGNICMYIIAYVMKQNDYIVGVVH